MREPAFWWRKPALAARLLAPLGMLYGAIAAVRLSQRGARAAVPVVCIGNPTVGGAGKTPLALTLARLLQAAGEAPVLLSRGYGGRLAGPPTSATSRSCSPKRRRPWWRATASRARRRRSRPARASS
jgi:tetraacyldisaccharide 4'-kinase